MTTTPAPRKIAPAELEASLEAYFRTVVQRSLGGMVIKMAPTVKGLPDRLVLLPGGRMGLVELKTTTGRVSPIQALKHERLAELGQRVIVLAGRAEVDRWVRMQFPTPAEIAADRKAGVGPKGMAPAAALTITRRMQHTK